MTTLCKYSSNALTSNPVQAALAVGLLGLRPWKPRTVGFLGVVASAMNVYMLFPAVSYPPRAPKPTMDSLKGEDVCPAHPELKTA